ncbi:MAG: KpsF/GutQ family sugar-phosphate isomerase [Phycisphaeraceae bacterium]|nr:KpsF/GutQ family sugar-phosphate isomerase [Phycisphaeraceae bacterium]
MHDGSATDHETTFIQEALEAEAEAIRRIAAGVAADARNWDAAVALLESCRGHVVVSGMGKSGLIGLKISATLASLGAPSHFIHPAEAVHGDLGRIRPDDVALLVSYSGETDEVVNLALLLRADSIPILAITGRPRSALARHATVHLSLGEVEEACPHNLAPTATTTAMVAVGDTLALALARRRNFAADDFHRRHPGGMLGVGLRPITEALRFRVGQNLAVVRDDLSVRSALAAAGEGRRAGAVVLVDVHGRLSGILTDGDLRRLINRHGNAVLDITIHEVMTARPRSLGVEAQVRDAVRMVQECRVDEIPVVDGEGRPVGLVDVQDLIAMKVVRE